VDNCKRKNGGGVSKVKRKNERGKPREARQNKSRVGV